MFILSNKSNFKYIKIYNIDDITFSKFCNHILSLYEKKEEFKIFFDLSQIQLKDFTYSKQLLDFMKLYKDQTNKFILKTIIIVPNSTIETLLNKFVFSFYKPVKPLYFTDSLSNASTLLI